MSLSFARMREAMQSRLPPPALSPSRLSTSKLLDEHQPWPLRYNSGIAEQKVFPEIIRQVRENFMLEVKFSPLQFRDFCRWLDREGVPQNLHWISCEYRVGWSKNHMTGHEIIVDAYFVRLMDIHWMWMEMA